MKVEGHDTHFDIVLSDLEVLAHPHCGWAALGTLVNRSERLR